MGDWAELKGDEQQSFAAWETGKMQFYKINNGFGTDDY